MSQEIQPQTEVGPQSDSLTVQVSITLTWSQWRQLARHHGVRAMATRIGLDDAQLSDFVLHQIFSQIKPS